MIRDQFQEQIPVLYHSERYLVVEKPPGLLIHPFKKFGQHKDPCLMKVVRDQVGKWVYPFHRLDRPVSGVVVFCLNSEDVKYIQEVWHDEETIKEYICIARSEILEEGIIDFDLKDENKVLKPAKTCYWPIYHFSNSTLLRVRIQTGRRHQIRRHLARKCWNIVGDTNHGNSAQTKIFREKHGLKRLFLHCQRIRIKDPFSPGKELEFFSKLPDDLRGVLRSLDCPEKIMQLL